MKCLFLIDTLRLVCIIHHKLKGSIQDTNIGGGDLERSVEIILADIFTIVTFYLPYMSSYLTLPFACKYDQASNLSMVGTLRL
jgi:hypothetical protein